QPYDYTYDASGNLTGETTSRHFEWDHSDRMRAFRIQPQGAEPSLRAYYLYDAAGQRVKKLVRKQSGGDQVTVYIAGLFEHHRRGGQANNTLHLMDDQRRIATVRVGPALDGDIRPPVQYHFGDHLGSSNVVVDGVGDLINSEEYTPYGET